MYTELKKVLCNFPVINSAKKLKETLLQIADVFEEKNIKSEANFLRKGVNLLPTKLNKEVINYYLLSLAFRYHLYDENSEFVNLSPVQQEVLLIKLLHLEHFDKEKNVEIN